jgi:hypothetical protein
VDPENRSDHSEVKIFYITGTRTPIPRSSNHRKFLYRQRYRDSQLVKYMKNFTFTFKYVMITLSLYQTAEAQRRVPCEVRTSSTKTIPVTDRGGPDVCFL